MAILNESLIQKHLKKYYNIESITTISKIPTGTAQIFYIKTINNKEYILKEFQKGYTDKEILKEAKILEHLLFNGILTAEYIKTINNNFYYVYKGKYIIIQKYISGIVKKSNLGNKKELIDCSKNLAYIIKALETFPELEIERATEWTSNEKLEKAIKKHIEVKNKCNKSNLKHQKIIKDMNTKIEIINSIKNKKYINLDKITHKNTHGDYNVLQLIYTENLNIKATIDFVSAKKLPIIWEIIRSYSYIDKDCKEGKFNIDNFVEYVKAFNRIIKLNEYDISYIVDVYLVQILSSTFGYTQYLELNNEELLNFATFRTNLCMYLFKNSSIIKSILEKEILI